MFYLFFIFHFFTATSDGTESNLNSTHGGHCNDTVNKIYMKLEVYVCHSNMTSTGQEISFKCRIAAFSPFYSCLLSDPAYEWQRGCWWPCIDTDLTVFIM